MHRFCAIAFLALQLLPASAHALSCAPPVIDKGVEAASIIFEGTLAEEGDEVQDGTDDMKKSRVFTFAVTMVWKGDVLAGDKVPVWRNTYWGDGFQKDTPYLVVATKRADGVLEAGLCGLTAPKQYAAKTLKILEKNDGE